MRKKAARFLAVSSIVCVGLWGGLANTNNSAYALVSTVPCNHSVNNKYIKTMKLTAEDNGREVRTCVGAAISVALKVQGGTGYNWYTDQLDENYLKPAGEYTEDISPKGAAGGPVLGVWCFKAVAPGVTRLRMLYYRAWEGKRHAVKSFEVRLNISESHKEPK